MSKLDKYTEKTKIWLDKRFQDHSPEGIYLPQNPIYGFQNSPSGDISLESYSRIYQVITALSKLEFKSFLDVGAADGYYSYLVKVLFGADVRNCDLSEEACKRAEEIFGIKSDPADVHNLPYKDNQFDLVSCTETLEHVTNPRRAIDELLRVARNAVVVGVPHEPKKATDYNVRVGTPHGHIRRFTLDSFDYLKKRGFSVSSKKIDSVVLSIPEILLRTESIGYYVGRYPRICTEICNVFIAVLKKPICKKIIRKIFDIKTVVFLIKIDELICKMLPIYHDMLFVIVKDPSKIKRKKTKQISVEQIIGKNVPYHYVRKVS